MEKSGNFCGKEEATLEDSKSEELKGLYVDLKGKELLSVEEIKEATEIQ